MTPPRVTSPRALLLDAGNTVVFLDIDAVAELLAASGFTVARRALRGALGPANRNYAAVLQGDRGHEQAWQQFMQCWLREAGVASDQASRATAMLRAAHDEFNLWRRVADGVTDAIAALRAAGIPVAMVSNSEGKLVALLERVGLGETFDFVLDSALEGVRKPDPEIFWRACRRLQLPPAHCMYAGDIPEVDVWGAQRAGLQAVLIDPFGLYPAFDQAPRYGSVVELAQAILRNTTV